MFSNDRFQHATILASNNKVSQLNNIQSRRMLWSNVKMSAMCADMNKDEAQRWLLMDFNSENKRTRVNSKYDYTVLYLDILYTILR